MIIIMIMITEEELRRTAVSFLIVDKETFGRGIYDQLTQDLWSSDSRPLYRVIEVLHTSESVPWSLGSAVYHLVSLRLHGW